MKELIKPETTAQDMEAVYQALAESGCSTVNIGCLCRTKTGYADEDQEEILF